MDAAQFTEMMKVLKEVMGGNGSGGKGGTGGEREHLNFKVFQGLDKLQGRIQSGRNGCLIAKLPSTAMGEGTNRFYRTSKRTSQMDPEKRQSTGGV